MGICSQYSDSFTITLVLVERDTLIYLQIKRPKPCNLSTMTPLVMNHVINLIDLAKKDNLCL
jgi:hypothetical protein